MASSVKTSRTDGVGTRLLPLREGSEDEPDVDDLDDLRVAVAVPFGPYVVEGGTAVVRAREDAARASTTSTEAHVPLCDPREPDDSFDDLRRSPGFAQAALPAAVEVAVDVDGAGFGRTVISRPRPTKRAGEVLYRNNFGRVGDAMGVPPGLSGGMGARSILPDFGVREVEALRELSAVL